LAEYSLYWEKYYSTKSNNNVIPVLSDWDMSPAKDYSNVIQNWESIDEVQVDNDNKVPIQIPDFKISTAQEFLDNFVKAASNIPKIEGERPPVWLYIHGPSHYQALKASRESDMLLCAAEKFSVTDAWLEKSMVGYPEDDLNSAWEAKIYPDHGWGGKEGDITDELFRRKFEFSHNMASRILENSLSSISSKILTDKKKGIPIIIFNSLNWTRSDPIKVKVKFEKGEIENLILTDSDGNKISVQTSSVTKYDDKSIKEAEISFVANEVPSIGYKTFYIKNSELRLEAISDPYESDFYKISFTDGGIESIYDKELGVELIDRSSFSAGEIFTMKSEGHGAGEFADIQQPTMDGFDKTSNYATNWEVIENGPVFAAFKYRQQIRNAVVENEIILYKKVKRIDFNIALLNWEGVLYREYRMAMPINMKNGQVSYETPFGVVNVGEDELDGAAGERYMTDCKDIHPRAIENWISANNEEYGVTLSSCVAVADYIDPTQKESGIPILQPILLASRKSCHSEGNEYLQTGDHHYFFSFTSHRSGWENGLKLGKGANEKLFVVVNPKQYNDSFLPEQESFFSVDRENVIVSTIKKAEDDNSVIVRIYDLSGESEQIELNCNRDILNAIRTNLIEEGNEELESNQKSVSLNLGKYSIETIKLTPSL
ncbi:MAG: glycoside hydrolase family 38 C-terminal domain-containing protein, partial [Melioribacteraceae bacterium]|nr:glycoside hydrolase family 38 C-terminal domain-containing protein [Melioribacteraceae bacterium]